MTGNNQARGAVSADRGEGKKEEADPGGWGREVWGPESDIRRRIKVSPLSLFRD